MKKQLQRLTQIALMLFVFTMMQPSIKAQTIGSQIRIGADSTISYWNGSAWITVAPGLPGQSLQFTNGNNGTSSAIPNNGLVAYFPFNGNANDASGNGNNGIIHGAALTTDRFGNANSAYSFDGISNYIEVLDNTSLNVSNITISAWINPTAFNSYLNGAGYWNNYSGFICKDAQSQTSQMCFTTAANANPSGLRVQASCTDGTYSDANIPNSVSLNSWQHIIYIFANGSVKIYKDGILVVEDNTNSGKLLSNNNQPLLIGRTYWYPSASLLISYFTGKIDDIRIYNRALTNTEIQALYHESPSTVKWIDGPQTPPHDIDGNIYDAVTIGTQTWMKQNLNVTHYRNGDAILTNITDNGAWSNLTTGAYCNYNNDANNASTFGRLYNWYTVVDARNLCPTGWHVPSDVEWTTLITYLGGDHVAGGKLKEAGLTHWQSSNSGATNETGFTALPSGFRFVDGSYNDINHDGFWWSSTEYNTGEVWARYMHYGYGSTGSYWVGKLTGFSVRCLKD